MKVTTVRFLSPWSFVLAIHCHLLESLPAVMSFLILHGHSTEEHNFLLLFLSCAFSVMDFLLATEFASWCLRFVLVLLHTHQVRCHAFEMRTIRKLVTTVLDVICAKVVRFLVLGFLLQVQELFSFSRRQLEIPLVFSVSRKFTTTLASSVLRMISQAVFKFQTHCQMPHLSGRNLRLIFVP